MMPFWPKDYISATRAKRLAERGAYSDLLFFQWELGVLPGDTPTLARLLGVSQDEFNDVWPAIKDKFVERDGGLVNERLEMHREKALRKRDGFRRGAAKTNATKALSDTPSAANKSDPLSEPLSGPLSTPHPSPSPSPIKDTTTAVSSKRPAGWPKNWTENHEGYFKQFKTIYPKRGGNQPWSRARKAINARLKEDFEWSVILAGTKLYAEFCIATGKIGTEMVMQAATFCGPDKPFMQDWITPVKQRFSLSEANRVCIREAKSRMKHESDDVFIERMMKLG